MPTLIVVILVNNSKKYWQDRADENVRYAEKMAGSHTQRLQKFYAETLKKADLEINKLYVVMLKDGGITTTNLYSFGRFAQLSSFIQNELQLTGKYQISDAQKTLETVYEETLKKTYIDIGSSLRWGFADANQMKRVIDTNWSGKHFSERIWGNTEELAYRINQHIRDLVSMGKMPDKIKAELMRDFGVGFSSADRLIRTEAIYIMNQSAKDSYMNAGISEYQFLAAMDEKTSTVCREHNNNIYPLQAAVVGENFPPLHPRCRSCVRPVINI